MKGGKWSWIRDKCIMLGYIESAKLAQAIEDSLIVAYGDSSTTEWEDLTEQSLLDIWSEDPKDIIEYTLLCRGCVETNEKECSSCRYGCIAGICSDLTSVYGRFWYMFAFEKMRGNK